MLRPSTRAALSAESASGSAMATLVSSFGTLQIASARFGAASSSSSTVASSLRCCRRQHHSLLTSSAPRRPLLSSPASSSPAHALSSAAAFSTTPARASLKKRRIMREWFAKGGKKFKPVKAWQQQTHDTSKTIPFPLNPLFRSQPVLGERTRELVWEKVVVEQDSIKAVAAELGIDMRRVAAVVRLKQIEKSWLTEGKPLARTYAKAVLSMLPKNNYGRGEEPTPHEPINEIHTHGYTMRQLFLPVSESRHFTREDAARAFHPTLLSADKRMPIPELVKVERDVLTGQRSYLGSFEEFRDKAAVEQQALVQRDQAVAAAEHARTTRAETGRFQFRIRDIDAENVGRDGRASHAVGYRYGVPFDDRKRGLVKIPTSVG